MDKKSIESPVSEALILICEKCSKHSRDLQQAMKKEIKNNGDSKKVRAVLTSCMNVCEDDCITVAVVKTDEGAQYFTVDDREEDPQVILKELLFEGTRNKKA
jgi:(2Fe-2S) ferredoxin